MKILQVYNQRDVWGGEDQMVSATIDVLRKHGATVDVWIVKNSDYLSGVWGKVSAFFSGIYSLRMKRKMRRVLEDKRPDMVHVHNLYPLLSASILVACKEAGIPVVLHCHNHFLTCPIGTHLRNGKLCEECSSGAVLNCVLHNCRKNLPESVGYAVRSKIANWAGWFRNIPSRIIVMSKYSRERLIGAGFSADQIALIPNVVSMPACPHKKKTYAVYVGRLSIEKGVNLIIKAAERLPDIDFRIAGDGPLMDALKQGAPQNVHFEGWLSKEECMELYSGALFAIAPSICYETFGLAAADAMAHGLPVIASNLGGLAEIIDDGVNGLHFRVGDVDDMCQKIYDLWHSPDRAKKMGELAHIKVRDEYSESVYYERLKETYLSLIK